MWNCRNFTYKTRALFPFTWYVLLIPRKPVALEMCSQKTCGIANLALHPTISTEIGYRSCEITWTVLELLTDIRTFSILHVLSTFRDRFILFSRTLLDGCIYSINDVCGHNCPNAIILLTMIIITSLFPSCMLKKCGAFLSTWL